MQSQCDLVDNHSLYSKRMEALSPSIEEYQSRVMCSTVFNAVEPR